MARLVVQQRVGFLASSDDGDSRPHGLVCIRRPGPVVLIEPLIRHNEADLPIRLPTLPSRHGLPHHPIAHGEGLPPPFALVAVQDAAPAACLAVSREVIPAPPASTEYLHSLVRTERSEARRVGKGCCSTCRSRLDTVH